MNSLRSSVPPPPADVRALMQTLLDAGYQAYLVGGCVRDALLGRPLHDYDVATDARPEQVSHLFPRTFATGLRHGTVTVWTGERHVEVTTYRIESTYSDGRRPDAVEFTDDLVLDLSRRDFTINALAADVEGSLVDPFDGVADLRAGRLRAVGVARQRFHEDGLRILRALRFVSELGFSIEAETEAAMRSEAARLGRVSGERIGQEMRWMATSAWWWVWPTLADGPWLKAYPAPWPQLAPRLCRVAAVVGRNRQEQDGFGRRWQAAWSDLSWPGEWGMVSAWMLWVCTLAEVKAEQVGQLVRAFGWPRTVASDVCSMLALAQQDPLEWSVRQWREHLFTSPWHHVAWVCQVLDWLHPGPTRRAQRFREMAATQPLRSLRELQVDGHQLTALGLKGRAIGEALRQLSQAVLDGCLVNEREALLQWVRQRLTGGQPMPAPSPRHKEDEDAGEGTTDMDRYGRSGP
jgi:tRNA nucleotidyltransferase (CCA-adding enzyme)